MIRCRSCRYFRGADEYYEAPVPTGHCAYPLPRRFALGVIDDPDERHECPTWEAKDLSAARARDDEDGA